jgi:hypothetical protein
MSVAHYFLVSLFLHWSQCFFSGNSKSWSPIILLFIILSIFQLQLKVLVTNIFSSSLVLGQCIFASVPAFFGANSQSQSPIISAAHYFSASVFLHQSQHFCIGHNIFALFPVFFGCNSKSQSPIMLAAHSFLV